MMDKKSHWENIYSTKPLTDVSWYQPVPQTSLQLIKKHIAATSPTIIDIGGGDSFLADNLLELGYTNITVLDISEAAIERAKERLGDRAAMVNWIVADVASFIPTEQYDIWHDRAAFHFLTDNGEIANYHNAVSKALGPGGILCIGTFSENGPSKCSGIEIKQYSETSMSAAFSDGFEKIGCFTEDHPTPFGTTQNFIFCSFRKV